MSLFLKPRGSRRATEGPGATERTAIAEGTGATGRTAITEGTRATERTAITEGTQVTECHGLRSPVYRMKKSCYSTTG